MSATEDDSPDIRYDVADNGVATITFNRPQQLNALTTAMLTETLPQMCAAASSDPAIKVVVITGTGRGFCTGADLSDHIPAVIAAPDSTTLQRPLGSLVLPVWQIPKPVIAALNGVAAGGGMSLACAADFRIMAESASFVAAFVRRGLMPDSGLTYLLPKLITRSRALRIMMTGAKVSAAEALELGLADEVVPDDDLPSAAQSFAAQLAAGPAIALSFTKRAVQRADEHTLAAQLEFESWGQATCFKTDDFQEGLAAFAQKRQPVFKGR